MSRETRTITMARYHDITGDDTMSRHHDIPTWPNKHASGKPKMTPAKRPRSPKPSRGPREAPKRPPRRTQDAPETPREALKTAENPLQTPPRRPRHPKGFRQGHPRGLWPRGAPRGLQITPCIPRRQFPKASLLNGTAGMRVALVIPSAMKPHWPQAPA